MTMPALRSSLLVEGPNSDIAWDREWRLKLVFNLEILVNQLWKVGITDIFIDSSFTEDVAHPNDIDGYFVTDRERLSSGRLQQELNLLDPHKVWDWTPEFRRPARGFTKKQLAMWHIYHVELYPHVPGLFDDDLDGNEYLFPASFRQCRRDGGSKGIIKILRS